MSFRKYVLFRSCIESTGDRERFLVVDRLDDLGLIPGFRCCLREPSISSSVLVSVSISSVSDAVSPSVAAGVDRSVLMTDDTDASLDRLLAGGVSVCSGTLRELFG